MDTHLDEKAEHRQQYEDKLKLIASGKPSNTDSSPKIGKTVKIRVTKKKRPAAATKDSPVKVATEIPKVAAATTKDIPVKVATEIPKVGNSPKVTGRLNEKLLTVFDELSGFMVKRGEPFKARAYQKAQESIIMYPGEITHENYKQLEKLPGIGETITHKIDEFVTTGTLRILERERADPQNVFSEIYGVGPKKALDIVNKGVKTISELREKQDEYLNTIQKVGLKYYDDILQRIPRSEIDEFHQIFNQTFESTKDTDTKYEIVGSYRRNAKTSGDIDVIITSNNKDVFKRFIDSLLEKGVILEILSRGNAKSLVIAKLPGKPHARRVDFLYTSQEEYPFAVLYFTGSKIFNTVMRGRALSMGYSLNEHGMYKMDGKKKDDKVSHEFRDERSIFDFLKMKYKDPEDRIDGRSVVPEAGEVKSMVPPTAVKEPENIQMTIEEPSKNAKTRKNRVSSEEKAANKENARIEKERVKQLEKERKEAEKIAQKESKVAMKELVKTVKADAKAAAKTQKRQEKEASKAQTKKKRTASPKINIEQNKIEASGDTNAMPTVKANETSACPICRIPPVDADSDDPILHAIQHFKEGGIGVLDKLTEETLNEMLTKTNLVYRNLGPNELPLITDNQYDILESYIKRKYPKNTVVGKIGAPVEKNKVALPHKMRSMNKIKPDTNALASWKSKYKNGYVLSCKLDGVSGLYSTENNESKLYTRGDGDVGQDVSHFIPYLNLPTDTDIVVRGEFVMPKATFSSKYADKFANGRNLVAGTINRLRINDTVNDIHFVAYEVIRPSLKPSEQMKFLKDRGFNTVRNETHTDITNEQLSSLLIDWRVNYDYEIDGVIVTDDHIYPRSSGNPEYSFAFKMALTEQMAETMVIDVEWNASKDGYLKPRVRIEPVHLSGVKIEYTTGFNAAFIESNHIGVGALIQIIRSGDVIPYINAVITPADQCLMPTVPYIWNDTHVDIMLENKDDDETVREKNITGFFKGIDVDGLGGGNVARIIEAGFDTIPKIIQMSKEDLLTIDGFKEKMANKLYNGIREKLDKASLTMIMSASNTLGRGFGEKRFEVIMKECPDILTSMETNQNKITRLSNIKGMASKTAQVFVENIPRFLGFLEDCDLMSKIGDARPLLATTTNETHELFNKSIAMSGSRDKELEVWLKSVGANMSSSVSSNTFALITPELDGTSGKIASAKKHGVQIFTPASFRSKYM